MDRSRIETHIKPLLGSRLVSGLTLRVIEGMQADIAAGRSPRRRKKGRGGRSTGSSAGVASRTIGTLRGLLGHAARLNIIGRNPAEGVPQLVGEKRQRRLSDDELRHLGQVMREVAAEAEHLTGLGGLRLMLLTGSRRMEVLGLQHLWFCRKEHCIRFPNTKSGAQIRVLGEAAMACIDAPNSASEFCIEKVEFDQRPRLDANILTLHDGRPFSIGIFDRRKSEAHRSADGPRASETRQCCAMSRWSKNRRVSVRESASAAGSCPT